MLVCFHVHPSTPWYETPMHLQQKLDWVAHWSSWVTVVHLFLLIDLMNSTTGGVEICWKCRDSFREILFVTCWNDVKVSIFTAITETEALIGKVIQSYVFAVWIVLWTSCRGWSNISAQFTHVFKKRVGPWWFYMCDTAFWKFWAQRIIDNLKCLTSFGNTTDGNTIKHHETIRLVSHWKIDVASKPHNYFPWRRISPPPPKKPSAFYPPWFPPIISTPRLRSRRQAIHFDDSKRLRRALQDAPRVPFFVRCVFFRCLKGVCVCVSQWFVVPRQKGCVLFWKFQKGRGNYWNTKQQMSLRWWCTQERERERKIELCACDWIDVNVSGIIFEYTSDRFISWYSLLTPRYKWCKHDWHMSWKVFSRYFPLTGWVC